MFRLGIVGHRYFSSNATSSFVAAQCSAILKRLCAEHHEVVAVSAIAEGADTLFAEAALDLDLPLEIVRPFDNYIEDFTDSSARQRYQRLKQAARKQSTLAYVRRSDRAYKAAMDWVIDQSDLLVAVWNGQSAQRSCGTASAVERVISQNCPWVHVDVEGLSVIFH
jgi:hypothetical protein